MQSLTRYFFNKFVNKCPQCQILNQSVSSLSEFLSVFDSLYSLGGNTFWFRGHSDYTYKLIPSALRSKTVEKRNQALKSIAEFRRLIEFKLPKPPPPNERFQWAQIAQHYGLPTRLLDWTRSPTISLYFACQKFDEHGIVYALDPVKLNLNNLKTASGIVDEAENPNLVDKYFDLDGQRSNRGRKTIAISPAWNSERIIMQQGAFTLHGKRFELDSSEAPSLVGLPILREHKDKLLFQLERIGISEMSIFPEPEHVCKYLKEKLLKG